MGNAYHFPISVWMPKMYTVLHLEASNLTSWLLRPSKGVLQGTSTCGYSEALCLMTQQHSQSMSWMQWFPSHTWPSFKRRVIFLSLPWKKKYLKRFIDFYKPLDLSVMTVISWKYLVKGWVMGICQHRKIWQRARVMGRSCHENSGCGDGNDSACRYKALGGRLDFVGT